ncbi:MAG TPA: hypothetical protein VHE34_25445 [Puia sp.]|uniref:hypothetical protein n=1 Tax=Puia sp. TaxID=2045100 RepID=UPI002C697D69|nr:hypothetical protein [Puia sp.]HVU98602.1 hypothetical protein [Puia sp.]
MKNEGNALRLTAARLQKLKDEGFRFVLIKGYSLNKRSDYIELNHWVLAPVMQLPEDPAQKEIYEPIDSEILLEWANSPDDVQAFIERDPKAFALL